MNNCVNRYKILQALNQSTRTPCRIEDTLELEDGKGWGFGYRCVLCRVSQCTRLFVCVQALSCSSCIQMTVLICIYSSLCRALAHILRGRWRFVVEHSTPSKEEKRILYNAQDSLMYLRVYMEIGGILEHPRPLCIVMHRAFSTYSRSANTGTKHEGLVCCCSGIYV